MNPRTEQRLKAAFTAKAEQVSEDRLPARRLLPDEESGETEASPGVTAPVGSAATTGAGEVRTDPAWRAHWIAPALAAAAVAAVAARAQLPPNPSVGQPDACPGAEPVGDA